MFRQADLLVALGLAAILVILITAFIFGRYNEERTGRIVKPLRLSTSWILVTCAWIILQPGPHGAHRPC